jgi:hypothetical protein
VAKSATPRQEVVTALASFDEPAVVEAVIDDLLGRGWVAETNDLLRATPAGGHEQEAVAPLVEDIRGRVAAALPQDDYATLVRLLASLVAAFSEPSR